MNPLLRALCQKSFDGDLPFSEFTDGVSPESLAAVEALLAANQDLFRDGVPFPGDNADYDRLLAENPGAQTLQKMMENWS